MKNIFFIVRHAILNLSIISFSLIRINVQSQTSYFHDFIYYSNKVATQKIDIFKSGFDLKTDTLNIYPCFVEWFYYPDWSYDRTKFKIEDSLYLKKLSIGTYTYGAVPILENLYSKRVINSIVGILRPYVKEVKKVSITLKDSLFLKREIDRIKLYFKTSKAISYNISDSLYSLFNKFNGDVHIVCDLVVANAGLHFPSASDLFTYTSFFVIDIKKKQIAYYKFDISETKNQANCERQGLLQTWYTKCYFVPNKDSKYPELKKTLKPFVKYLKRHGNR